MYVCYKLSGGRLRYLWSKELSVDRKESKRTDISEINPRTWEAEQKDKDIDFARLHGHGATTGLRLWEVMF